MIRGKSWKYWDTNRITSDRFIEEVYETKVQGRGKREGYGESGTTAATGNIKWEEIK